MPSSLLALTSVARSFGLHLDARRMMRDNQLPDVSISPTDLMRCSIITGLRATGLRPGWQRLVGLSKALPAIVILRDGEAMVLLRVEGGATGQQVVVQDPRAPDNTTLTLDHRQFAATWTGEVILVQRSDARTDEAQPFTLGLVANLILREHPMLRDIAISALMMSLLVLLRQKFVTTV